MRYTFFLLFMWQSVLAQNTISSRFGLPQGFERITVSSNSFGHYLRNFTLKATGTPVMYFDGRQKPRQVQVAVLDIDRGTQDLQQCADAVMRLRAEYLFAQKREEEIAFKNFGNTRMDWKRYAQGYRMTNKGYQKNTSADGSKKAFRQYLNMVFNYANTYTLQKELKQKSVGNLTIGDVFITSSPNAYGHAMLIMDVAINAHTGEKIFLLAQSYMPAQDIHIVENPNRNNTKGWYYVSDIASALQTPEWIFPKNALHEF